jgi:hypothetical protein
MVRFAPVRVVGMSESDPEGSCARGALLLPAGRAVRRVPLRADALERAE